MTRCPAHRQFVIAAKQTAARLDWSDRRVRRHEGRPVAVGTPRTAHRRRAWTRFCCAAIAPSKTSKTGR